MSGRHTSTEVTLQAGYIELIKDCAYPLQVNSETDFATKTEQFQSMVQAVASAALALEATGGPYR